jgi:hypothetical protein
VFLANIEISHPGATDLFKRGAISLARSFVPGNKTIEETFMKHSKSHGGAGGGSAGLSQDGIFLCLPKTLRKTSDIEHNFA